jgi:multidrug efflux pump subunit AcrB
MLKQLPPGTNPPLILQFSASNVPVLELGLSGTGLSEQQLNDGGNFIRTQLATVQGASVPLPYGGKLRQIQVDLDPVELQLYGLSPSDVLNAVTLQNIILPAGTIKIDTYEYQVETNSAPSTIDALNHTHKCANSPTPCNNLSSAEVR